MIPTDDKQPAPPLAGKTVSVPKATPDQREYLDSIPLTPQPFDRSVVIGGPKPAPPLEAVATVDGEPVKLPSISLDGPHLPCEHRLWLARQLLDSRMTDEEAYSTVAYSPAITDTLATTDTRASALSGEDLGSFSPKRENTQPGASLAVLALLDEVSALCTSFNDQIHDADDVLGQINQLTYRAIAAVRPDLVRATDSAPLVCQCRAECRDLGAQEGCRYAALDGGQHDS